MSRRIYIRHGEKEYTNNDNKIIQFKHDPGLTENGKTLASLKAIQLIKDYGIPSSVIVSPFLRTRQTAEIMLAEVEKVINNDCKRNCLPVLYHDITIGEYLGNQKNCTIIDITSETKKYDPIREYNMYSFRKRVRKHNENEKKCDYKGVSWFITHGLVIKQLTYLNFGVKLKECDEVAPLDHIIINNQKLPSLCHEK